MHLKGKAALPLVLLAFSIASLGLHPRMRQCGPTDCFAEQLQAPLQTGAHLFDFNYQKTSEVLIVKVDPETGDRWAAHLSHPQSQEGYDATKWEVQNAGSGPIPLNHQADGFFILHLLDTLRTLQVDEPGSARPLTSLGLAPPALRAAMRVEGKALRAARSGRPKSRTRTPMPGSRIRPLLSDRRRDAHDAGVSQDFSSLRLKTLGRRHRG